jgi:transcriptional regulator with XRE-family HTH domain
LADVAKRIGASSRNAYARYEHGTAMPKLDTVQEILKTVAPELALTVGPRKGPRAATLSRPKAKRRGLRS